MKHTNEPQVIAIAGKGGVGKTTIGGMLVRYLLEEEHVTPILAVDADPNANLNDVLGVEVHGTIGEAREMMKKDVPTGMTKDVWFEYKVNEAIVEGRGFDLLVMGRPEGPGCYCAANSLAKQSIDMLKKNYASIIVDNEAGMEHMSRMVTQDLDMLYIVSDGTPRGIMTAKRISRLIAELGLNIKRVSFIVNRALPDDDETIYETARKQVMVVAGIVHHDDTLLRADRDGKSIFTIDRQAEALNEAYRIFRRTLGNEGL